MRCSGCGREIAPGDKFCQDCGIRVSGGEPSSNEPIVPPEEAEEELQGAGAPSEVKPGRSGAEPPAPAEGGPPSPPPPGVAPPPPIVTGAGAPIVPPVPLQAQAPAGKARGGTSGMAIASLVLGITCFFIVPIVGAILAIVFGAVARGHIKQSGGQIGGMGMANAGLALGVVGLVIPVVLAMVLIPIGVYYVWPPLEARRDLLKGVDAAKAYYFQSEGSYSGMTAEELTAIDGSVDFRQAPGSRADVVYISYADADRATLYCYSRTGRRYSASAIGTVWRYSFHVMEFERDRWWNDLDELGFLFDGGSPPVRGYEAAPSSTSCMNSMPSS